MKKASAAAFTGAICYAFCSEFTGPTAWCSRINDLPLDKRSGLPWHYVLLAEPVLLEWQAKGARLADLLDYVRLRLLADASTQSKLI